MAWGSSRSPTVGLHGSRTTTEAENENVAEALAVCAGCDVRADALEESQLARRVGRHELRAEGVA
jgi:hypothetical protein